MPFWDSFLLILSKIAPTLILPLVLSILLQLFAPKVNNFIARYKGVSFYLWSMALMITLGQTIDFMYLHGAGHIMEIVGLSVASMLACAVQFAVGRAIGRHYGDTVSGGQGLGQRNTALAIWMSTLYLQPLAATFPAMYSIWQNLYNSYQLWRKDRVVK